MCVFCVCVFQFALVPVFLRKRSLNFPLIHLKDVYGTFNVFMRRRPKENNFKVRTSPVLAVPTSPHQLESLYREGYACAIW